jgi:hypothetical protein
MSILLRFLLARARERSSWLGVITFLTGFGIYLEPEQVEALAALGISLAGAVAVLWKDPGSPTVAPVLLLVALLGLGCVHYDGAAYRDAAAYGQSATRLTVDVCDAHRRSAVALTDSAGSAVAYRVPFGAGDAVPRLARAHAFQSRVCDEAWVREATGRLDPSARLRMLQAWSEMWRDGSAVLGGE